ncbi:MAG TPA: Fic family protein [Kofleriaceae bacterium]|nr:Fic family protein [Kofleriaceae bacterium]
MGALKGPDIIRIFGEKQAEVEGHYLHWDELRHRSPPAGLSHESWWLRLDTTRKASRVDLSLRDTTGTAFGVSNPDSVRRLLYTIDRDAAGRIEMPPIVSPETRDRYVIAGLTEEAITSSQLEGAATTRRVAKEMLRSNRRPTDAGEQMIFNNYLAMQWIRERQAERPTPAALFELHRILVTDTDAGHAAGRFRTDEDMVHVVDDDNGEIVHIPPPANQLPQRLDELCRFATSEQQGGFIHPVVRAILMHFWLAFDHPFVDDNGRTARALFYWQMLRTGYWVTEFLSISKFLKMAPSPYYRSFLHVETTHDTTYFVLHQLGVMRQAIDDVFAYVRRTAEEDRAVAAKLRADVELNHRQRALIARMLKHPLDAYTIEGHQRSHGVAYATARSDLLDLVERGWLEQRKVGRAFVFSPVADLEQRLGQRPRRKVTGAGAGAGGRGRAKLRG